MSRTNKSSSSSNKKPQQSSAETAGWTTKLTRQKKKNLKKPKPPKPDPSKQHKKKSKRRNKKNKLSSSNGYKQNSETPTTAVLNVINDIVACYPRFKSDTIILQTVVIDMNLKSFDPNDDELKAKMFESINEIKLKQLNQQFITDNIQLTQSNNTNNNNNNTHIIVDNPPPNKPSTPINNNTQTQTKHDDDDDDESIEQKESSESAQMEQKSDVNDDDKKSLSSEPHDHPQRKKKKRKRARRKRAKTRKEDHEHDDDEEHDDEPEESNESSTENIPEQTPPKPHKKRKSSPKPTLRDKLNNLNLLNMNSAIQQLNEWINLLRDSGDRDRERDRERVEERFLSEFVRVEGLEIIVNKIILDLGSISENNAKNRLLSQHIITLFDILLTGSREYHEWLFSKMLSLSSKLREVKALKENKSLISIICNETKNLIRAQSKKELNSKKEKIAGHKPTVESATSLLSGGHESSDPIVGILSGLDGELSHLCTLYDGLDSHIIGGKVSGNVNKNISIGFNKIQSNLSLEMSSISRKSHRLEEELFSMKSSEEKLNSEQCSALRSIGNNLSAQEKKRLELLSEKKRIESELLTIIGLLSDIENNIMINKERLVSIQESFKPKLSLIFSSMSDRQFEIASLSQKSSILQLLLSISEESYNLLSLSRIKQSSVQNNKKRELENNYINCLYTYLDKLVSAKLMVLNRQQQLNQHIESFKRTNETTNKYYGHKPHKPYQQQLKQYREIIKIDIQTNKNISQHIYKNISRAKEKISPALFRKFINHLQQEKIGKIIDLSKYKQTEKQTQTSIQTQTQVMNGHQQVLQQQERPMLQQQQRSKPPITKKKQANQENHNQNNAQNMSGTSSSAAGAVSNMNMGMNRRPPRPHYAGKRKAPVPNTNHNSHNSHQRYQQY